MPTQARMTPTQFAKWSKKLGAAAEQMRTRRTKAVDAEMKLREAVVAAAKAGMYAATIAELTGLSPGRVNQIKRGTRR